MRRPKVLVTLVSLALLVAVASLRDAERAIYLYDGDYAEAVDWREADEGATSIWTGPVRAALIAAAAVDRWVATGLAVLSILVVFTIGWVNDRRRRAGLRPLVNVRREATDALIDIGAVATIVYAGLLASLSAWLPARPLPHVDALGYLGVAVMTAVIPVRVFAAAWLGRGPRALEWPRRVVRRHVVIRRFVVALGVSAIGVSLWYVSHSVPGAERALVARAHAAQDGDGDARRHLVNFHAHSSYSDGFYSPASLIELLIKNGFHATAVTDHNDIRGALAAERIARERHPGFLVIPGIEFTTRQAHLLLLGVRENITPATYSISDAIRRVHELGGLVIVAHWRQQFATKEQLWLWGVDGFEIANWMGGEGLMDRSVVEFCKTHRARESGHPLIMIGDTDTHGDRWAKVANEVDSGELTVQAVLESLRHDGRRNKVVVRDWKNAVTVPTWTPMPLRDLIYTMTGLSPVHVVVWALFVVLAIQAGSALLRVTLIDEPEWRARRVDAAPAPAHLGR